MRSLWTLRIAAGALALGGAIVACYDEVPGPQGPRPAQLREAPPPGPTPRSPLLLPAHVAPGANADAEIFVPSSSPARISVPIVAQAGDGSGAGPGDAADDNGSGVAPTPPPPDAAVDSLADLPREVPDAGSDVHFDAGLPLRW